MIRFFSDEKGFFFNFFLEMKVGSISVVNDCVTPGCPCRYEAELHNFDGIPETWSPDQYIWGSCNCDLYNRKNKRFLFDQVLRFSFQVRPKLFLSCLINLVRTKMTSLRITWSQKIQRVLNPLL